MPLARKLWLAATYAVAMVGGTALLMAALAEPDAVGKGETRADVIMQSTAERALVSPQEAVLATQGSNERRGI